MTDPTPDQGLEVFGPGDLSRLVAEARGVTPQGLPYPETSGAVAAGANDIKALALAADGVFVGPWVPVTLGPGFTGSPMCRREGGSTVLVGAVTGTFTGGPTPLTIPAGYRPVFPAGSGLTYYGQLAAAGQSGNSGFITVRFWANGSVTVVAINGTIPVVDFSSCRFASKGT